jgi:orotidine 5'-phosphate decarboxylase subfamily 2
MRILEAAERNDSLLCVGLDSEPEKLPESLKNEEDALYRFNCEVVEATLDLVCCYKPNMAFYEAQGLEGLTALEKTIRFIDHRAPVILDAKRGDIGNTARNYAHAAFEWLGADAVTVNPYLGYDSISPYLEYEGKGIFILCLTSNEGSRDFQLGPVESPLYEQVAKKAVEWDKGRGQIGLVVGATHPTLVGRIRFISDGLPFLLPGIGAQGGSLECVSAASVTGGGLGVVVNASRSVIYAGKGRDFANQVREAAEQHRRSIGGPRRGAAGLTGAGEEKCPRT